MKIRKLSHILFIIAVIFVFLLLPQSITTSAQYATTAFAVGLGIDQSEKSDGVSVCAQIVAGKPNTASSQNYQIVSSDGIDVSEALDNLQKQLGKGLGLSHCYVIVVSDEVCNKYNIVKLLDPIVRTEKLGTNVILAHTTKNAKELLLACEEIGGDAQNVLESLTKYNHEHILNKDASIYNFYQDYYSENKTGIIVTIDYEEESKKGSEKGSEQQSGGASQEQTNTTPQKKVKNEGKAAVFLKGEKVGLMDEEILKGLGWMDCTSKFNNIKLYGVNTEKLKNATVTLSQTDCKIKPKASLNNNTPTLNLDLFVKAKIVGIEDENPVSITNLSDCFNEVLAEKLQEKVTQECSEACEFQREKNIDVLNFYQIFNTQIHKEWQNYLKSLDSKDEYASKIQVFVKTHLTQSN